MKLASSSEVAREILTNLNPKKVPGYDFITDEVLKQLSRKSITMPRSDSDMFMVTGRWRKL